MKLVSPGLADSFLKGCVQLLGNEVTVHLLRASSWSHVVWGKQWRIHYNNQAMGSVLSGMIPETIMNPGWEEKM